MLFNGALSATTCTFLKKPGIYNTASQAIQPSHMVDCWQAPSKGRPCAGEIFGGLQVSTGLNDGQALLEALSNSSNISEVLSQLLGPWSIVYWDCSRGRLWFGRDALGMLSSAVQRLEHDLSYIIHQEHRKCAHCCRQTQSPFSSRQWQWRQPGACIVGLATGTAATEVQNAGEVSTCQQFCPHHIE